MTTTSATESILLAFQRFVFYLTSSGTYVNPVNRKLYDTERYNLSVVLKVSSSS